ncbi:MAG: YihY/virulence factor BrkB family protein, partial [Christensenellales bacterium]
MKRYVRQLVQRTKEMELSNTSAIISYYFLLSFFPLLVCVGMALSLSGIRMEMVHSYLESVIPGPILDVVYPIFDSILDAPGGGGFFSLSILGTLWSAGRGLQYIRYGINRAYGQETRRHFVVARILSVVTLVGIMLLMIVLVLSYSFGESLLAYLYGASGEAVPFFNVFKWPVTALLLSAALVVVYKSVPDEKFTIREILPGVVFSAVGLMLLVQGFSLYINLTSQSLSAYGAMGSIFILILWVR